MNKWKLNRRQKLFIEKVLEHGDIERAGREAGYKAKGSSIINNSQNVARAIELGRQGKPWT